jgi:hypothetical protein
MNRRLDDPPVIDASVARHMGLFAVAHLGERHGVRVRLRAAPPHGVTALVWLPENLITRGIRVYGGPLGAQADLQATRMTGRHSLATRSAAEDRVTNDQPAAVTAPMPTQNGDGMRETVPPADPGTSNWFRSRRPSAAPAAPAARSGGGPSGAAPQAGGGRPPGPAPQGGGGGLFGADGWAESRQAAQIIAEPVRGDRTVAGLPVRVPRANLLPGSVGGGRHADGRATSRPADGHEARTPTTPLPQRSPDMARSRLTGFQRGTRRAEGQTPRTEEGADR